MKTTLSTTQAADMLMSCEAFGTCKDAYSLCYSMAEWLEQYEEDTGEELELDPIAIRCEYRTITLDEVVSDYQIKSRFNGDDQVLEWLQDRTEETRDYLLEWLQARTEVVETDIAYTYIIQEF